MQHCWTPALLQAAVGAKVQGVVTGIQDYGVFVSFYGRLHGLAAAADLGLLPGQAPSDAFQVRVANVFGE